MKLTLQIILSVYFIVLLMGCATYDEETIYDMNERYYKSQESHAKLEAATRF